MGQSVIACAVAVAALAASWSAAVGQGGERREAVHEGALERLVLDDGEAAEAASWVAAEATVTADSKHVKRGGSALRFHIDVNWETGEPKYPIGWPRIDRRWSQPMQDWSSYDYLEFAIYTGSSRTALPVTPLGLILSAKEGKSLFSRSLTELRLGQWTDFRIPLADVPGCSSCAAIKFYISESNYKHGDSLDFWIDNLSLTRYVEPTVTASHLAEGAVMCDAKYLTMEVAMMGIRSGEKAEVTWQIASVGKVAASGKVEAPRGKNTFRLPLPSAGLPAGSYAVRLLCKGTSSPAFQLRVVPSPWQEGAK